MQNIYLRTVVSNFCFYSCDLGTRTGKKGGGGGGGQRTKLGADKTHHRQW